MVDKSLVLGVAAGVVLGALASAVPSQHRAFAETNIRGIPGECQVDTCRIASAGVVSVAPATSLSVLSSSLMLGWWAQPFFASWDGKRVLTESLRSFTLTDGSGHVAAYEWPFYVFRSAQWAPDSKHLLLWKGASGKQGSPEGVAVLDVDALGPIGTEAKHTVVCKKTRELQPFSASWSPRGTEIYVACRIYADAGPTPSGKPSKKLLSKGSVIQRLPLDGGPAQDVFRTDARIDGVWLPASRYQDGSGPNDRPFRLLVRATDGLWLVDSDGAASEQISRLHQTDDVVWSPGPGNMVALVYESVETVKDGVAMRGVYLCNLDRCKAGKPLPLEQLTDNIEVHTIWFSPQGKYVVWATRDEVWYRAVGGPPEAKIKVVLPGAEGLEIKGCIWNAREDRLAVVAGNRVFIHQPASSLEIATVGEMGKSFVADPHWNGDDLLLGCYTNVAARPVPAAPPAK